MFHSKSAPAHCDEKNRYISGGDYIAELNRQDSCGPLGNLFGSFCAKGGFFSTHKQVGK